MAQVCTAQALATGAATLLGIEDGDTDSIIVYLLCQWINKTMSVSCAANDLANAAKCFQCLEPEQKQWVITYLLALIAGGSTDPNTIVNAAASFQAIPPGMFTRVQAYLLCQIVNK